MWSQDTDPSSNRQLFKRARPGTLNRRPPLTVRPPGLNVTPQCGEGSEQLHPHKEKNGLTDFLTPLDKQRLKDTTLAKTGYSNESGQKLPRMKVAARTLLLEVKTFPDVSTSQGAMLVCWPRGVYDFTASWAILGKIKAEGVNRDPSRGVNTISERKLSKMKVLGKTLSLWVKASHYQCTAQEALYPSSRLYIELLTGRGSDVERRRAPLSE